MNQCEKVEAATTTTIESIKYESVSVICLMYGWSQKMKLNSVRGERCKGVAKLNGNYACSRSFDMGHHRLWAASTRKVVLLVKHIRDRYCVCVCVISLTNLILMTLGIKHQVSNVARSLLYCLGIRLADHSSASNGSIDDRSTKTEKQFRKFILN